MISLDFRSNLALYMVGLIEQKQALGYKYEEQVKLLKKFDAFCFEYFPDEKTVTKAMLDIWAVKKSYEHPGTLRGRVTVVSHLARHMAALGHSAYIYPTNELPRESKYIPHIYSEDELRRLFLQIEPFPEK